MKKKRQAEILKLISTFEIETQEMLLYLLKERGYINVELRQDIFNKNRMIKADIYG